jgi:subtilase family serine protease
MKRMMVIGAVAAAVVILAGAGLAVASGQHTSNGSAVCGKILSITPNATDPTQVTIVVQNKKGTTTITADANTKVRVDKQKVALANLTVGEKIHARVANGTAQRISGTTKVCKVSHKHNHAPATPSTPSTPPIEATPVAPVTPAPVTPAPTPAQ